MKIYLASDHAGFELKKVLIEYLKELWHDVEDKGPYEYNPVDDYPDFISRVAEEISKHPSPHEVRGLIMGGSGQGEAMVANRYPQVRAAVYYGKDKNVLMLSRQHNDANVLSLAARLISAEEAKEAVRIWLETPFSGEERHIRRIKKIDRTYPAGVSSSEEASEPELPAKGVVEIIPAIMPKNFADIEDHVCKVRGLVSTVQIDVMDGKFVPEKNWPYNENGAVSFRDIVEEKIGLPHWKEVNYEIDLMIEAPEKVFHAWEHTGVSRIIIHRESVKKMNLRTLLKTLVEERASDSMVTGLGSNIELGFAFDVDAPNSGDLYEWIAPAQFIQLMGIAKIGYQGEPFDERVIEKIKDLRWRFPDVIISIDGGVSLETAPRLIEAGANRLVVGSAIFESENIPETIKRFKQLAGG